jgi:hypothetical protein
MLFNCGVILIYYNCICILFSSPWRWTHEWPQYVSDYYILQITLINPSAFVGPFKNFYTYYNYTVRAVDSAFDVGYTCAAVGVGVTLRPFYCFWFGRKNSVKLNAVFWSSVLWQNIVTYIILGCSHHGS